MENLIQNIVKDSKSLKDKYTDQMNVKVNYACIFCRSEEEQNNFFKEAQKLGTVIQETSTGPLFKIYLDTIAGKLQLLKIRKPDPTRPERGDADFTVSDYPSFKKKYLDKPGFSLIKKENFEMIELYEKGNDVRTYFSFPPLDKQLNLTSLRYEKTLKFAPDLVPKIISGEKTSTWRLFDDKNLQQGDNLTFINKENGEIFGTAIITSLYKKTLGTLTSDDWIGHEKFAPGKMYTTYRKYYGDKVGKDSEIKILSFSFTPLGKQSNLV